MTFIITGWRANGSHASVRRTSFESAERCAQAMARTSFSHVHITVRGAA